MLETTKTQMHVASVLLYKPVETRQCANSRVDEGLVDALGLLVSLVLLPRLLLESLPLVERIVQLGVRVADLLGGDERLESLAESGSRSVSLGERGHHLRVADYERANRLVRRGFKHEVGASRREIRTDEGGVDALVLDVLSDELLGTFRNESQDGGKARTIACGLRRTLSSRRALVLGSEQSTLC